MSSGGYGQDGLPWASSHHNSHLVMWHIPLAISGQQYSAPDRSLTFWPKVEIPFELPFFVPTASGLIEGRFGGDTGQEEMFTFKVTSGRKNISSLVRFIASVDLCSFEKMKVDDDWGEVKKDETKGQGTRRKMT